MPEGGGGRVLAWALPLQSFLGSFFSLSHAEFRRSGTYCVVRLNEWIIDSDNVNIIVLDGVSEDDTANSAETVDTDLDWCHFSSGRRC